MNDFYLTDSDLKHLELKYRESKTSDFLEYFTALANERRIQMKADLMITNPTSSLIKKLSVEIRPSISSIKHYASRHKWRKSAKYLSGINRSKAIKKNHNDLVQKASYISNPTDWFRSINEGQTLIGKFDNPNKCKSISSMLARWNHTEGVVSGIFISAKYYWELSIITIKAIKRD